MPLSQQHTTDSDTYEVIRFPGGHKVHVPIPSNKALSEDFITTDCNAAHVTKEYMDNKLKQVEEKAYREGYVKGLNAASIICIPRYFPTNLIAVDGHPDISRIMEGVLTFYDPDKIPVPIPPKEEYPHIDLPSFEDAPQFLGQLKDQHQRCLGTIGGEQVRLWVIGHVPTIDEDDNEFFGKCFVSYGENYNVEGYCIGFIERSGTGIVIASDERIFAYQVPIAINPPWKHLNGSSGAELFIDGDGKISLELIPQLRIESQEEF